MAFQVPPEGLPSRRLPAALVAGGIALVVGVALVSASVSGGPLKTSASTIPAEAVRQTADPGAPTPVAGGSPSTFSLPPSAGSPGPDFQGATRQPLAAVDPAKAPPRSAIDCHDLAGPACEEVVWAALHLLGSQAQVASIGAWRSVLCTSALDCPPPRFAAHLPLGSAIATLASGDAVWIDVLQGAPKPTSGEPRAGLDAWVIRWIAPVYPTAS